MSEKGLYEKYKVIKAETGEEAPGVFILNPYTDPIAIAALQKYAELTPNKQLENDLSAWVEALEMMGSKMPPKCDYCEEVAKVKSSPFMADAGASMCEYCWDKTRSEYIGSQGEDIGKF